jgi:hypothetical protein
VTQSISRHTLDFDPLAPLLPDELFGRVGDGTNHNAARHHFALDDFQVFFGQCQDGRPRGLLLTALDRMLPPATGVPLAGRGVSATCAVTVGSTAPMRPPNQPASAPRRRASEPNGAPRETGFGGHVRGLSRFAFRAVYRLAVLLLVFSWYGPARPERSAPWPSPALRAPALLRPWPDRR